MRNIQGYWNRYKINQRYIQLDRCIYIVSTKPIDKKSSLRFSTPLISLYHFNWQLIQWITISVFGVFFLFVERTIFLSTEQKSPIHRRAPATVKFGFFIITETWTGRIVVTGWSDWHFNRALIAASFRFNSPILLSVLMLEAWFSLTWLSRQATVVLILVLFSRLYLTLILVALVTKAAFEQSLNGLQVDSWNPHNCVCGVSQSNKRTHLYT